MERVPKWCSNVTQVLSTVLKDAELLKTQWCDMFPGPCSAQGRNKWLLRLFNLGPECFLCTPDHQTTSVANVDKKIVYVYEGKHNSKSTLITYHHFEKFNGHNFTFIKFLNLQNLIHLQKNNLKPKCLK